MNLWIDRFERAFGVFALFYYTNSLFTLLSGNAFTEPALDDEIITGVAEASSPMVSLFQWCIFAITLLLIGIRWKHFAVVLTQRKLIWGVVIIALASVMWSSVPDLTIRRSIGLAITTLLGMYLAMRFKVRELMYMSCIAFGLTAIINFLFTVGFPQYGMESRSVHAGAWRGLLSHKNSLARMMVLTALNFLLLMIGCRKYRFWLFAGLILSIAIVLFSTSKTGLSILLFIFALVPLFRALRWRYNIALPAFISLFLVLAIATIWAIGNQEMIFMALGRDATLTGRTDIWDVAGDKISERLWLGYGYKSFWLGREGDSVDIFYRMNWQAPNGHNGYLDLMLDLGLLGLLSFAISFLVSFRRAIVWLRLNPGVEGLWPIMCLSFLLLYNITESSLILEPMDAFWLLYTVVSTSILIQPIPLKQIPVNTPLFAKSDGGNSPSRRL
jgi:exopolysaccharide production protein ExoQ